MIDSQAVGKAEVTIKYLSPYVFRVAISNSRIIKVEDRYVYFRREKTGSRQWKTTRLEVMDFIHHFLQHVLPSGFMKVRHYGFLNPSCGLSIAKVRELIEKRTGESVPLIEPRPPVRCYCQDCGGNKPLTAAGQIFRVIFKKRGYAPRDLFAQNLSQKPRFRQVARVWALKRPNLATTPHKHELNSIKNRVQTPHFFLDQITFFEALPYTTRDWAAPSGTEDRNRPFRPCLSLFVRFLEFCLIETLPNCFDTFRFD